MLCLFFRVCASESVLEGDERKILSKMKDQQKWIKQQKQQTRSLSTKKLSFLYIIIIVQLIQAIKMW